MTVSRRDCAESARRLTHIEMSTMYAGQDPEQIADRAVFPAIIRDGHESLTVNNAMGRGVAISRG